MFLSNISWHLPQAHLHSFQTDPHPGSMRLNYSEYSEDKVHKYPLQLGTP